MASATSGYAMTTASAMLYSCTMLLLRLATDAGAPAVLSVAARFGFQTLVYSGHMVAAGVPLVPSTRFGRRMLLATTLLICIGGTCYMLSSALAPLGDAGAISGAYPIGTLLIARVWLQEPLGLTGVPSILLCALGVAIISRDPSNAADGAAMSPDARHSVVLGYVAAAVSAAAHALSYAVVRRAGDAVLPLQYSLSFSALGFALAAPWCPSAIAAVSAATWRRFLPPFLCMLPCGLVAQLLLSYGSMTPGCSAGVTALLSSSEVIWAYVLQVVVLRQPTTLATMGGAALVVLAIVAPFAEARCRADAVSDAAHQTDVELVKLVETPGTMEEK